MLMQFYMHIFVGSPQIAGDGVAGVRDSEGIWEVMFYGKNLFDTERVISREATPYLASYRDATAGFAEVQRTSDYRGIKLNSPREFGINFRYNF
ncbi:hypothetical protein [Pseudomaricurvus sp. HS19]|uniref:hypothetical protein n=1 Tax=Pseudomaricurvus sp. HS19 TaxID=2692626 RepID=UPI00136DD931|nr:hypothetical protein [Pseudomaricurvus sp. HS19]MYM63105.1 hypothetical protein [Pseudomaricurvus sp. HS19]